MSTPRRPTTAQQPAAAVPVEAAPAGLLYRTTAYAVVVVLAALCAVWGAFLVPLRVHGVPVPLSVLIAVVGNLGLGYAGGRITGRLWGLLVPPVLWLVIVLELAPQRPEGDVVLPNTATSLAFLGVGAVAGAGVVAFRPRRRP